MSITKTIGTLLITAAVGTFALVFSSPKKVSKNKVKTTNTRIDAKVEGQEELFI